MRILNELETAPIPIEEEEKRRSRRLLMGVLCALLLTGIFLGGYLFLRKRHSAELAKAAAATASHPKGPPKVEVYVDDAILKDKDTVLGGTVHNISREPLANLAIELEMKRRGGSGLETKVVPLHETNLLPDARGEYSIVLSAKDYLTARLLGVVAGDKHEELPYKTFPGIPRPMATPVPDKTVMVKRPGSRAGEFINTPDKPERVP